MRQLLPFTSLPKDGTEILSNRRVKKITIYNTDHIKIVNFYVKEIFRYGVSLYLMNILIIFAKNALIKFTKSKQSCQHEVWGYHGGEYEAYGPLGCDVVQFGTYLRNYTESRPQILSS